MTITTYKNTEGIVVEIPTIDYKTLRDDFAGQAMQGMLMDGTCYSNEDLAKFSYAVADAMLEARNAHSM